MAGLNEEMEFYQNKFHMHDYDPHKEKDLKDLVVIWHNGIAPVKEEFQIDFIVFPCADGLVNFSNDKLRLSFNFPLPQNEPDLVKLRKIRVALPNVLLASKKI